MRMGQGVRTGLGHGGITCVLQTQFSNLFFFFAIALQMLMTWAQLFKASLAYRARQEVNSLSVL